MNLLYTPSRASWRAASSSGASGKNFQDGFSVDDYRIQFSFKYNFSYKLGGK